MAAKIFRINYKSDFILTMQSDAGWATPFCIKFWTGAPSIAYFAGWDGTTYIHCALDGEDPTKLHVQFDDHHLPIGDLKFQIAYHFTVEDFPNNTEDEVINQAAVIIDQDGTKMQVMLDLNGETAPEIEFNLPAYANEAQRIANENQRIANEAQRIANEEQRIANEEQRISNEEQRIAAESIRIANEESRISEFAQLKHDAEIATADANAAATLANEKAALAAEKAALSQAAAELANAKATLAQQKADYAQAQGDYAKAQGDYAKDQGNIAEADHERAESDHTRAENDHTAVEVYVDSLGAFDISAYHATGGVLAKYVDLSAALDGGDNIPEAIRKGGMSVKFVQSSDNKYVQYRLMHPLDNDSTAADDFTNTANWQGVDDEPTAGSDNLVKSGGVSEKLTELAGKLDNNAHALFNNLTSDYTQGVLNKLIKRIEVVNCNYQGCIIPWRLNIMNDSTYRLYFVTDTPSEGYIFYKYNIPITQNYVEIPCNLSAYTGTLRVWVNLTDATEKNTLTDDRSHNIISKECYIQDVEDSRVTEIENNVTELQQEIQGITGEIKEFNSGNMSDFTSGYYLPPTATSFSVSNLVSNINLCYKYYQIPEDTKIIEVYSGFRDNYPHENIFFLANDNSVIERKSMLKNGIHYLVPSGTVYICVCYLKDYIPFGFVLFKSSSLEDTFGLDIREQTKEQVENDIQDYSYITQTHQEITLRDVCYEMERRNPFNWKPFNKKWFAFMNDDSNQDMTQYYKVCRDRRVPYCHAFILDRFSSYSYTGNDANRRNLVKNPAIGQSYTFDKLDTQTYLRLYFDRQYSLGFPLNITVNNVSHTINSADNARILIGDDTSVSFTITSIGQLTSGRTDYINIIATADSADSSVSTVSWTTEEMLKNIVFDFGEILAHANDVINMWDLKQVEEKLALYLYGIPQSIDNILGEEHCKGAILPGGPNSERNMNTDIGQHYCCRYILYSDYYGTTPQYMIQRTSYSQLVGSATVDYATAKANALSWLSNHQQNGFYPLFTHSEKTPEEVAGVIDAILETEGTICSNWYTTYYANS